VPVPRRGSGQEHIRSVTTMRRHIIKAHQGVGFLSFFPVPLRCSMHLYEGGMPRSGDGP
jgi:hypothetical protein